MITVRPSEERGHFDFGWLDTRHTFSFGRYIDRRHTSFRALRVINEDVVVPGAGFPQHPHEDMEIVTYVLKGTLAHRDTLGSVETLSPGEVQRMSAGRGIEHSEFNASKTEPVHLLQIWLFPEKQGIEPSYEQKRFAEESLRNRLCPIVTPDAREGSLKIHQDASIYAARLDKGAGATLDLKPGRHAWVQVASGTVTLNGMGLNAGDGAAVSGEDQLTIVAGEASELLVFDLA